MARGLRPPRRRSDGLVPQRLRVRRAQGAAAQLPGRRAAAARVRLRRGEARRLRRGDQHDAVRGAHGGDRPLVRDRELPLGPLRRRRVVPQPGRLLVPDGVVVPLQPLPHLGRHQRRPHELARQPADDHALPGPAGSALGPGLLGLPRHDGGGPHRGRRRQLVARALWRVVRRERASHPRPRPK